MKKEISLSTSIIIAWNIMCEIMTRSEEPLILTTLYPCGSQYKCLAIKKSVEADDCSILINLQGSSILARGRLFRPYQELYEKDSRELISNISNACDVRLAPKPIRELYVLSFIKHLINKTAATLVVDEWNLSITSAWYDGSYNSRLDGSANRFHYYEYKESEDIRVHLPWWTISYRYETIAMCNMETDELITMHGNRYKLQDKFEREQAWLEVNKEIQLGRIYDTSREAGSLLFGEEWEIRYRNYANQIKYNLKGIYQARKAFREWSPLKFYMNFTNAKRDLRYLKFGVHYLGQKVAELIINTVESDKEIDDDLKKYTPLLNTKANKYDVNNAKYFDWQKSLNMVDWRGDEAKEFRNYFRRNPKRIEISAPHNEEHRIKSLLLTEFSKHNKDGKALPYIQPVKIAGVRFSMSTPLSASNHKAVKYSGVKGGGIDILARVGKSGRSAKLCVIEVKDENNSKEPPLEVIKQAVAYATFIRELIRSESGYDWWEFFGFSNSIPKNLTVLAACAMPSNENNDYSFANKEIKVANNDIIRLHYIYFKEKDNKIIGIESSLNQ